MKHTFQTEINQLLDLMINSLYSNKEIFLRELISNASDALDKLNYLTLSDEGYKNIEFAPKIQLSFDEAKNTLTIEDNGVGMSESELIEHLGTIAKSGTKSFLNALSGDKKKDSALIGQFGVGFYASFMVADKVVVASKKPNEAKAYAWISDGKGEFEIAECAKEGFGTKIDLYLKDDAKEFANRWKIENLVHKYSEHIAFPIILAYDEKTSAKEGEAEKIEHKTEQINKAKALWKIAKSELKDADYTEFYQNLSHDNAPPLSWIHTKVEGNLEYTTLFYIPSKAPFDIYRVDYQSGVKLYVKRVFITDDDKELLPQYLRFVRGVIDSEDLPLNVSREILQQNKILANIKSASTKKILSEIEALSRDAEKYKIFHAEFGKLLKEGLYSDYENKDKLLSLCRFHTTKGDFVALKDYIERAKGGESSGESSESKSGESAESSGESSAESSAKSSTKKHIYYHIGSDLELLKHSPMLEGYAKNDIEVLLLCDEIDSFVMPSVGEFEGYGFKNIAEETSAEVSEAKKAEFKDLLEATKEILGEKVKEVRLSNRLEKSPACAISEALNPMLEQLMRQMGQEAKDSAPIFELNPQHALIKKLKNIADKGALAEVVWILFDNARLLEKGSLSDASGFAGRIYGLLEKSL